MSPMMRAYRDVDAAATLAVFRRAVRITAAADYTAEQIAAWSGGPRDVERWNAGRANAGTVVVEVEGRIAAFGDLDGDGHLDMLFVDPDAGGRGVGSALLRHLLDLARASGFDEVTVDASRTARRLFERHGFRFVAEQHPVRNGVDLVNFRLCCRLGGLGPLVDDRKRVSDGASNVAE